MVLNIVSLNCNGLKDIDKLQCAFSHFYENHSNIVVLLQETFWSDVLVQQIKEKWNGNIIYSNGPDGRQGVAVLVSNDIRESVKFCKGINGRFLHVNVNFDGNDFDVFNRYAPRQGSVFHPNRG